MAVVSKAHGPLGHGPYEPLGLAEGQPSYRIIKLSIRASGPNGLGLWAQPL